MSRLTSALALAVLASAGAALAGRRRRSAGAAPSEPGDVAAFLDTLAAEAAQAETLPPQEGKARYVRADTTGVIPPNDTEAQVALLFVESDPYAVHVVVARNGAEVSFVVSRDAMAHALAGEAPRGLAVLLKGVGEDFYVSVRSKKTGEYQPFRVPSAAVRRFLVQTLAVVPLGEERVAWDQEERALGLAAGTLTDDPGRLA